MLMEIQKQKIVSGCKNPFRTFYIAVMRYGVWLLIFAKGADANIVSGFFYGVRPFYFSRQYSRIISRKSLACCGRYRFFR